MEPEVQMIITSIIAALSSSGFTSFILYFVQRKDKRRDKKDAEDLAESKMILGLGHDKILYLTDRFVRRGAITLKEKRNLEYLWVPYDMMGGNGDCKIGYEACQKLPIVSDEKAEELDNVIKRKRMHINEEVN